MISSFKKKYKAVYLNLIVILIVFVLFNNLNYLFLMFETMIQNFDSTFNFLAKKSVDFHFDFMCIMNSYRKKVKDYRSIK